MIHSPSPLSPPKAWIYELLVKVKPIPFFVKRHLPFIYSISNHLEPSIDILRMSLVAVLF